MKRSDHTRRRACLARCASTKCSRTVRPPKSSGCWKVRASPRSARRCGRARVTSSPSSRTVPAVGLRRPESTPNNVLFPAPLGPTRPTMVCGGTVNSTPSTATNPPNRTVTPRQERRAVPSDRSVSRLPLAEATSVVIVGPGSTHRPPGEPLTSPAPPHPYRGCHRPGRRAGSHHRAGSGRAAPAPADRCGARHPRDCAPP